MTKRTDRLQLGAMLMTFPGGSWRYPAADNHRFLDLSYYVEVAQALERGGFDFIFFADKLAVPDRPPDNTANSLRKGTWGSAAPDPAIIVSALAASTQRIGLAYTISTSYHHPFNVARTLGTLDHLSGGRAAWNVVTSHEDAEAQNFGLDQQRERSDRYDRAEEFLETVFGLWDTWEDGAVVHDRERNMVIDPDKVHPLNHQGEHFQVRGPLNLPRPPQGYPVIAQAGSSERGREFAARWAEVIFTPQPNIEAAQKFYRDVKSRMAKYNRKTENLKILPGVFVIVGETEAIAKEKELLLQEGVDLTQAIAQLSTMVEKDLRGYPVDEPVAPVIANVSVKGMQGHVEALYAAAVKDELTLGQLARRIATGLTFAKFVGSANGIADQIEEWFEAYACDGFIIRTAYSPGMSEFARLVIPELRRRNLVRGNYEGKTLRDHLYLARPPRHAWRERSRSRRPD
jgi:FMN-dependent oxidoreductase (nitrilotriacetate monooxygenase family)